MQKKTQKVKNNKKSDQTQKGGLFGFLKNKKTYDVEQAQVKNKPIELGSYRKLKNSPIFSKNQLNEFNRLREAALTDYNKHAKARPPRVYNSVNNSVNNNSGSSVKPKKPTENVYESINNLGTNNGYGTNNGTIPVPPPRNYIASVSQRTTNV